MRIKRNLIIFIIVTLSSGWLGVLVDTVLTDQPDGNSLGMGLWLILPLMTAIILRIIDHDWKHMGIKLNIKKNVKWYLLSLVIYPAVTVITVGLAIIFGGVNLSIFELKAFLPLMMSSIVGGFIKNIFEEFAWRGYLTPKLIELKMNDWIIYLVSGIVWALWHSAYYLVFLPASYFESITRIGMLLKGIVLMVCWTVMFIEIYRLSKSVWPCVLMHAVEDAVPTLLTTGGFIVFTRNSDLWWNPVEGVLATVLFLGIGLFLKYIRVKRYRNDSTLA